MIPFNRVFWIRILEAFGAGFGGFLVANYSRLINEFHGHQAGGWKGIVLSVIGGAITAGLKGAYLVFVGAKNKKQAREGHPIAIEKARPAEARAAAATRPVASASTAPPRKRNR